MEGKILMRLQGIGDKASGRFECEQCKVAREFYGKIASDVGCRHLRTPYMDEEFTLTHWTRTRDERLQTERRRCVLCKTSQPVGKMIVHQDRENTGQPIWKCCDDVIPCYYRTKRLMRRLGKKRRSL